MGVANRGHQHEGRPRLEASAKTCQEAEQKIEGVAAGTETKQPGFAVLSNSSTKCSEARARGLEAGEVRPLWQTAHNSLR